MCTYILRVAFWKVWRLGAASVCDGRCGIRLRPTPQVREFSNGMLHTSSSSTLSSSSSTLFSSFLSIFRQFNPSSSWMLHSSHYALAPQTHQALSFKKPGKITSLRFLPWNIVPLVPHSILPASLLCSPHLLSGALHMSYQPLHSSDWQLKFSSFFVLKEFPLG